MGILEDLQAKMDLLIVALNENTKAGIVGTSTGAATDKPKATRTAKPKDEAPKIDEATLVAKFDSIKGDGKDADIMTRLKGIIAGAGFASLKELRMAPAKFDETFAALEAFEVELITAASATEADDDL